MLALTAGLNILLHIASEQRLKGVCETHNVLGEKFKSILKGEAEVFPHSGKG